MNQALAVVGYIQCTFHKHINKIFRKFFEKIFEKFSFFLFVLFVCSLARSFENFSKFSSRRRDRFGPKIVQFRPILAIFRPFENSTTDAIMGHLPLFATLFPRYLKGKGDKKKEKQIIIKKRRLGQTRIQTFRFLITGPSAFSTKVAMSSI